MFVYVEAMNQVLDENMKLHPLKEQREMAAKYRNIGIGVMGLADALIKLGLRYGSRQACLFTNNVMELMFKYAVYASNKLAKEYGVFPGYSELIFDSDIIKKHFSNDIIEQLKVDGLRNCSLLSVAPTGSIATMLGISTGVEPYFSDKYTRKTVSLSGEGDKYYTVSVPIFQEARRNNPDKISCLVTAKDIDWEERIDMQAYMQDHVDTAISSTVNLPSNATSEEIGLLYYKAWSSGLKGITIYRDGSRDPILSDKKPEENKKEVKVEERKFDYITPVSRKTLGTTCGSTFCKKCACGTLYITCNRDSNNNFVEVFTHTSKGGICQANMNAVTRMISLSLRSGVKIEEIDDQLKGINCPACSMSRAKGNKIDGLSCPDIIASTIKQFVKDDIRPANNMATRNTDSNKGVAYETPKLAVKSVENTKDKCPECGALLTRSGGCYTCLSCGYSKCGD